MSYAMNDHFVNGMVPVADAFDGTKYTDIVEVDAEAIEFIVYSGVGATGTSTFTVEACDDVVPTATNAVPFWYKEVTSDPGDATWTRATAAGWTRTAGSNAMFLIHVPADLIGENAGYKYARLAAVEVVNSAVLGGVLIRLVNPKSQPVISTVLT